MCDFSITLTEKKILRDVSISSRNGQLIHYSKLERKKGNRYSTVIELYDMVKKWPVWWEIRSEERKSTVLLRPTCLFKNRTFQKFL